MVAWLCLLSSGHLEGRCQLFSETRSLLCCCFLCQQNRILARLSRRDDGLACRFTQAHISHSTEACLELECRRFRCGCLLVPLSREVCQIGLSRKSTMRADSREQSNTERACQVECSMVGTASSRVEWRSSHNCSSLVLSRPSVSVSCS